MDRIRNFSIIAHIDHGKSTLADRILEVTGAVDARTHVPQMLDSMELERERGITIKAQAVRVSYSASDGETYHLHLIDTPGHVDFSYEVSRSLAACEGALLVVDAAQGVEAQTVANAYAAIDAGLELIPVLNKVDLPGADPDGVAAQVADLLGGDPDEALRISAKTGEGVTDVLEAIVQRIPPPEGEPEAPPRALIFDSEFDQYRGVVAFVRMFDGRFAKGEPIEAMQAGTQADIDDIGFFTPKMTPAGGMAAGEVGYVITGIKDVTKLRVGDTLTSRERPAAEALPGYREVRPMVFCGLFPIDTDRYSDLRDALDRLALNDAALSYEPETSDALGFGFRCGFLGLLHMDIVRERLEREYDLELLATTPNVRYEVKLINAGEVVEVRSPTDMPDPASIESISEPYIRATIITPNDYVGAGDGALPEAPRRARRHPLPTRRRGSRSSTTCRWPRSCSTSSTSSSRAARATPRSTTSRSGTGPRTWSSSTCCSPGTRSMRSRSSSTRRPPTTRGATWSSASARPSRGSSSTSRCRPRSAPT